MRDPDLMGRAQRAATELEQAWDRWRTVHGVGREPMPAVSSYVGYSLEEPWGQPRVVFGIEAREAEQLAALLDRHDCPGPVYAGLAAVPGGRSEQELLAGASDRGRVVVPTQAQATMAEREAAWREATWRESSQAEGMPPEAEAAEASSQVLGEPGQAGAGEPPDDGGDLMSRDGGQAADVTADELADDEPEEADEPAAAGGASGQPADTSQGTAWSRQARGPSGHALPRLKRGNGAARGVGGKRAQE